MSPITNNKQSDKYKLLIEKANAIGIEWLAQDPRTVQRNALSWYESKGTFNKYSCHSPKNILREPQNKHGKRKYSYQLWK